MPAQFFDQLPRPGLYLITPDGISDDPDGLAKIQSLITSSDCIALLQYRDKLANLKTQLTFVSQLQSICQAANVPLIINDDVHLAAAIKAAGVHLGKDDMPLGEARSILGKQAIIGASCYNNLQLAESADRAGADYLAFGSMFTSQTKANTIKCPLSVLRRAKQQFTQPLVAIGGLTAQNSKPIIAAGASWLAVISDIFSATDPAASLPGYQAFFIKSTTVD